MVRYLLVGFGGFLGAVARFWIGDLVSSRFGTRFPLGTFLINCSGCFVIGLTVTLLDSRTHWNSAWRYLIPIGFIGAFTTFSTFEMETLGNLQEGKFAVAALNILLSVAVGLVAVWLGVTAGNLLLASPATASNMNSAVQTIADSAD